jgi:hypothetical protein
MLIRCSQNERHGFQNRQAILSLSLLSGNLKPSTDAEQHVSALAILLQRNLDAPVLLPALCRLIRSHRLLLTESLHEHVDLTIVNPE